MSDSVTKNDMLKPFEAIKNGERTVDLIVESMKDALLTGRIKPGDALPSISDLAGMMRVGVSSMREALKMLEVLGVLDIKHGKGIFVRDNLDDDTMNPLTFQFMVIPRKKKEFIEFRKMFETSSSLVALKNATPWDIKNLKDIIDAFTEQTCAVSGNIQHELDFHNAVFNATHNQYIIKMGKTMLDLLVFSMQKQPARAVEFNVKKSHIGIYEAFRDKNEALLLDVLDKSLTGWEIKYLTEESDIHGVTE